MNTDKNPLQANSACTLTQSKGIHDAKNPSPAPINITHELFDVDVEQDCIHTKLNIKGSGISYQHGDHIGVWPKNPNIEVNHPLHADQPPVLVVLGSIVLPTLGGLWTKGRVKERVAEGEGSVFLGPGVLA